MPIMNHQNLPFKPIGLLAAASMLVISACGSTASSGGGVAPGQIAQASTLQSVLHNNELRAALCLDYPPFGSSSASGTPEGFDVDVAAAMAKALGVKLTVVPTTPANRIPTLQTGKADVVLCTMDPTNERSKTVVFSTPYVVGGQVLLSKKGSGINGAADLSGKTVAVIKGSTNIAALQAANPNATAQAFDDESAAVLAVQQGKVDAMVDYSPFLGYEVKQDPSLQVTSQSVVPLEYEGIAMKQGDDVWRDWVDQFLINSSGDGTLRAINIKWMGMPSPYSLSPPQ